MSFYTAWTHCGRKTGGEDAEMLQCSRLSAVERAVTGLSPSVHVPLNNSSFAPDALVILDVSDIQLRLPNPHIRIVSRLFWDDQGQAEQMLPFSSHGRSYLISTDESGGQAGVGRLAAACARGASPYGFRMSSI
jgi:hypothetical protein